jgi:hypothetical protein
LARAWQFYRECRAVGEFPPDPLVRYAAAELRDAAEALDAVRHVQAATRVTRDS